jgi:hypothetical protein
MDPTENRVIYVSPRKGSATLIVPGCACARLSNLEHGMGALWLPFSAVQWPFSQLHVLDSDLRIEGYDSRASGFAQAFIFTAIGLCSSCMQAIPAWSSQTQCWPQYWLDSNAFMVCLVLYRVCLRFPISWCGARGWFGNEKARRHLRFTFRSHPFWKDNIEITYARNKIVTISMMHTMLILLLTMLVGSDLASTSCAGNNCVRAMKRQTGAISFCSTYLIPSQ